MKCIEVVVWEAAEDGIVGADVEDLEESFGELEVDWGVSHSLRVIFISLYVIGVGSVFA